VRPKASSAGLICRTHQHYKRQWLWDTAWSNSRRWTWARDRWLRRERVWEKGDFFRRRGRNVLKL